MGMSGRGGAPTWTLRRGADSHVARRACITSPAKRNNVTRRMSDCAADARRVSRASRDLSQDTISRTLAVQSGERRTVPERKREASAGDVRSAQHRKSNNLHRQV